jgi:hypothetical protein
LIGLWQWHSGRLSTHNPYIYMSACGYNYRVLDANAITRDNQQMLAHWHLWQLKTPLGIGANHQIGTFNDQLGYYWGAARIQYLTADRSAATRQIERSKLQQVNHDEHTQDANHHNNQCAHTLSPPERIGWRHPMGEILQWWRVLKRHSVELSFRGLVVRSK